MIQAIIGFVMGVGCTIFCLSLVNAGKDEL